MTEKRSIRSFCFEKFLQLTGMKSKFTKQADTNWEALVNDFEETNEKKVANPEKYVGIPVTESYIDDMLVFSWNDHNDPNQKIILYFHGGAYVMQPVSFHFKTVAKIAKETDAKVIFPVYPKLPKYNYLDTYPKIEKLYVDLLDSIHSSNQITIMGDSAGGGLSLGFIQLLRDKNLPQPQNTILISPWLDIRTNNPEIRAYDSVDPMLPAGVLGMFGDLWSDGKDNNKNPLVSPIFGDLTNLKNITMFVGTHEIFYPDIMKFDGDLTSKGISHQTFVVEKMNHVFAIFPIPEAKKAQKQIIEIIHQS